LQRDLVRPGVDPEEHLAGLDAGAFQVGPLQQDALHPCVHLYLARACRAPGELGLHRQIARCNLDHLDCRRRWRGVRLFVALVASRQ